jgi:hypothetical protein
MTSWLPSTSSRHAKVSRTTTPSRDSPYCWKAPHTPGGQGSRVLSSHGQKPKRQFETSSHQVHLRTRYTSRCLPPVRTLKRPQDSSSPKRETIRDFRSLLDAAREVEAVMRERSSKPPQSHQRRYVTNVPIAEIWAMT